MKKQFLTLTTIIILTTGIGCTGTITKPTSAPTVLPDPCLELKNELFQMNLISSELMLVNEELFRHVLMLEALIQAKDMEIETLRKDLPNI